MTFFIVLLAISVAAAGFAVVWVGRDGGPVLPRDSWVKQEWSQGLPSRPYASRLNQQFSSAWNGIGADRGNRAF